MSHINVSNLNDSAQAKTPALEEKLNEATRCLQLVQTKFQVRLQEQDAQKIQLLEELNELKFVEEVNNPILGQRGKETTIHQENDEPDNQGNDYSGMNLAANLSKQASIRRQPH